MKSLLRSHRIPVTPAAAIAALVALLAAAAWSLELPTAGDRSEALLRHARYLASDELMGRGVDHPAIDLARDYIAAEFKRYGLTPGGDNGTFFQSLEVLIGANPKQPSTARIGALGPLALNDEWIPFGFSASGSVEADFVFAGYGITAEDYGYDDYAGMDVKGKIVLVLRYEPPPKDNKSPFRKGPRYSRHAALLSKAENARAHGAVGMILVDLHPPRPGERGLVPIRRTVGEKDAGIVAAQVKREAVERSLEKLGVSLSQLKERIDREEKPASTSLNGLRASLTVTLEKVTRKTDNVVGVLAGTHPELKKENLVIGAHYDHIGLGHFGTRDAAAEGQIHNGADDNASGTAVLLHLAERLSRRPRPARTIVFIAFTAEEMGTRGSNHYVSHPTFPLESTKAMINLDMVGRMKDNRLIAAGADSAKEFRALLSEAAREFNVEINPSPRAGAGSDHAPFHRRKIPVLHFYTGSHEDYHKPTDDWEKLNVEGMAKLSDIALWLVEKLAMSKQAPTFVHAPQDKPQS